MTCNDVVVFVYVLSHTNVYFPSSRHREKDAEFLSLCKSLNVTDTVCDRAWMLWKNVQESMDEVAVCIFVSLCDIRFALFAALTCHIHTCENTGVKCIICV